jgi:NADH:ubiquinone oxidoreductase subunit 6 (subunit J)
VNPSDLIAIYFYVFAFLALAGAVGVVALRSIFHSALSMIVCLFAVAGFFVLLNAEFLAAVQVIIYVGAIMVLIIFAILLSTRIMRRNIIQTNAYSVSGFVFSALFFLVSAAVIITTKFVEPDQLPWYPVWLADLPRTLDNTTIMGWSLMATYTLPFEIASILLLMALIGGVILANRKEDDE